LPSVHRRFRSTSLAACVAALAAAVAWRYHGVRAVALVFLSQLLAQAAVSLLKPLFHRHRPEYWLVPDELGFSYPSGHVVTTIVFYLALIVLVSRSEALPRPLALASMVLFGALACGIPWSRLALGAHYLTDVMGGALFGLGWTALALAIFYAVPAISARSSG